MRASYTQRRCTYRDQSFVAVHGCSRVVSPPRERRFFPVPDATRRAAGALDTQQHTRWYRYHLDAITRRHHRVCRSPCPSSRHRCVPRNGVVRSSPARPAETLTRPAGHPARSHAAVVEHLARAAPWTTSNGPMTRRGTSLATRTSARRYYLPTTYLATPSTTVGCGPLVVFILSSVFRSSWRAAVSATGPRTLDCRATSSSSPSVVLVVRQLLCLSTSVVSDEVFLELGRIGLLVGIARVT